MKFLTISFYKRYQLHLAFFSLFLIVPWAFPQLPAVAATNEKINLGDIAPLMVPFLASEPAPLFFPAAEIRSARYVVKVPVTAYSSTPDQTDDTPFITASGTRVRWGVVAANFLPIGTRLRLPDYYGDQVFIVEDRMNARYNMRLDIWMETRADARAWGVRHVIVEVL